MRDTILIIDDQEINVDILSFILQDKYKILKAYNGKEGIECINNHTSEIVLVLLDLFMPKINGIKVLEYIKEKNLLSVIPVIIITSDEELNTEREVLNMGATDFIRKPFDHIITNKRISNIVELYTYKSAIESELQVQFEKVKEQAQKLEKNRMSIINIMGSLVESRSLESGEHINRVKYYTRIIGEYIVSNYNEKYNLSNNDVNVISNISMLHDIGKIAIPDNILLKPDKLTEEEFNIIKKHSSEGAEIINNIKNAWDEEYDKIAYDICKYHHERWDGNGYPDGLKGDEIPITAQIVSIADVFDALTHKRCYKEPVNPFDAYYMIAKGECGSFNPILIEALKANREKFYLLIRDEEFEQSLK